MKKKEEIVEDDNVGDNNAVVGSTVLGESILAESEESEESDDDLEKVEHEIVDNPEIDYSDKEAPKTNEQKLADLIYENPDIPVIPLVDGEVVTDKAPGYYTGSIGESWVDEYFIAPRDTIFFKEHWDDTVWTTAIFVRVEQPEK